MQLGWLRICSQSNSWADDDCKGCFVLSRICHVCWESRIKIEFVWGLIFSTWRSFKFGYLFQESHQLYTTQSTWRFICWSRLVFSTGKPRSLHAINKNLCALSMSGVLAWSRKWWIFEYCIFAKGCWQWGESFHASILGPFTLVHIHERILRLNYTALSSSWQTFSWFMKNIVFGSASVDHLAALTRLLQPLSHLRNCSHLVFRWLA